MASPWTFVSEGQTVVGAAEAAASSSSSSAAASLPRVMYRSLATAAATPGGSIRSRGGGSGSRRGGREQDRIPLHPIGGVGEDENEASPAKEASLTSLPSGNGSAASKGRRKSRVSSDEKRWLLSRGKGDS